MFSCTKEKVTQLIQGKHLEMIWHTIGIKHHFGVDVPISSIRSSKSSGIGEYLDLFLLLDFCKDVGFDVLQLLPVNDSSFDPSPYNAMSSLALHPIYLSLHALPYLDREEELKANLKLFQPFLSTEIIAYHEVLHKKILWLKKYYENTHIYFENDPKYIEFLHRRPWIKRYALYKTLREDVYQTIWKQWPEDIKNPTETKLNSLLSTYKESIDFHSFLQYLCHIQLSAVKERASSLGILMKGDIPILLSQDSVDMWLSRHYFDDHFSVGTPPDDFNHEGQYWGFPAYNWKELKFDHYAWWKQRLESSSSYYHLYRLDHAVGFYRLWLVPPGCGAKNGFFRPDDIHEALKLGHDILSHLITQSNMLPIAEDLGMIPHEVFSSLRSLAIPGTKVIRWVRHFDSHNHHYHYHPYHDYHPLNLTCVSTHDSTTLQGWWETFPKEAQDFCRGKGWHYEPKLSDIHRYKIMEDSIKAPTLFHINLLQEYLSLCKGLTRENASLERINVPGFFLPTNWTYKFLPTLEDILNHSELKSILRALLHTQTKELP